MEIPGTRRTGVIVTRGREVALEATGVHLEGLREVVVVTVGAKVSEAEGVVTVTITKVIDVIDLCFRVY